MTKNSNSRGALRRAALVEAGVALLGESGWVGVTHRAVAARAEANPGLVHYYFEGSAGLRLAVAESASRQSIGQLVDELLLAVDEAELVARISGLLDRARQDQAQGRLVTEVVSAAFGDPAIGAVVRTELARARQHVAAWIEERHPSWSPQQRQGAAALIVATVDGLTLHLLLDPALETTAVVGSLQSIERAVNPPEEGTA